nr:MAG TPA: hypothetical protein [Caudoviricetes sp.]
MANREKKRVINVFWALRYRFWCKKLVFGCLKFIFFG